MAASHTMFGRSAAVLLAPLETVHTIVTVDLDAEFKQALRKRNIRILEV